MKFLSFLILAPLLAWGAVPVTPIYNGKLITPLDGNSQSITNLGPIFPTALDLAGGTNLPSTGIAKGSANLGDVMTFDGSDWNPAASAAGVSPITATNIAAYQAKIATNALGSAAFQPTSAFDAFLSAYHATNGLGSAAFTSAASLTNGLPRGVTASGVATATTNASGVVNIAVSTGGGPSSGVATNEYWVSWIPGPTGSGTSVMDPMDASSQVKFDAVMDYLRKTNNARTIHIMEGKYSTTGQYGGAASAWPLLSNTRVLGDGMGRTEISLAAGANRTNATICGTAYEQNNVIHGGKVTNVEVAQITFNGNGTNAGVIADRIHGVSLVGKDMAIRDCEFINFFGNAAANAESFCASISGMEIHLETNILANANAVIERCVFRDFLGDYGNGPGVFECDGFRISKNVIYMPVRTNGVVFHPTMHGMNIAGDNNGLVEGNIVYGASDGIYTDGEWAGYLGNTNITVIGNQFIDVAIGWQISPYHNPPGPGHAPNVGWKFIANDVKVGRYASDIPNSFVSRGFQIYGPVYDTEIAYCKITGPDEFGTNFWSGYVGGTPSPGTVRINHCVWPDGVVYGANCWGIGVENTVTNLQLEANYTPEGKLADNIGGAWNVRQTNIMHSATIKNGIIDMLPFFVNTGPWTNTTGLKFWNSNDCALYLMGTNGVKAQLYPASAGGVSSADLQAATNNLPRGVTGSGSAVATTNGSGVVNIAVTGAGGDVLTTGQNNMSGSNYFAGATRFASLPIGLTDLTNTYPWGSLYDAAGAATAVTNTYPWGSLYDAAGTALSATNGYNVTATNIANKAALNATNGLGSAAFSAVGAFDASGAGTTAAQNATNGLTSGQIQALFPGTLLTNNHNAAITFSNNVTVDASHSLTAVGSGLTSVPMTGISQPGPILTNNYNATAVTFSNNVTVDASHTLTASGGITGNATTASYVTQNPLTNNPVTLVTSWGGNSNTLTLAAYPQVINVDATHNFAVTNISGTLAGQYRSAIFIVSNSTASTISGWLTNANWRLIGPNTSTLASTNGLQIASGKVGVFSVGAQGTAAVIWSDSVQQ